MEMISNIQSLLRPEMAIIVAFCYAVGNTAKNSERIENKMIPAIVMLTGACMGAIYTAALEPEKGVLSVIVGFMQGAVAGFSSTGIYEAKRNILG